MADKPYQSESSYSFTGTEQPADVTPTQQVFSFFSRSWSSLSETVKTVATEVEKEAAKLRVRLQEEQEALRRAISESKDQPESPKAPASSHPAPWENLGDLDLQLQEDLKNAILAVSKSHRNFTNAPPEMPGFVFSLADQIDTAMAALDKDPNLNQNYFYRVHIIKQAYNIPATAATSATTVPAKVVGDSGKPQSPGLDPEPSAADTAGPPSSAPATPASTPSSVSPAVSTQTVPPPAPAAPAGSEKDSETIEFASEFYGGEGQEKLKSDLQSSLSQLGMTEDELVADDTLVGTPPSFLAYPPGLSASSAVDE